MQVEQKDLENKVKPYSAMNPEEILEAKYKNLDQE